jgi:hypothetical protein
MTVGESSVRAMVNAPRPTLNVRIWPILLKKSKVETRPKITERTSSRSLALHWLCNSF